MGVSPQLCTSCLRVLSSLITGSQPDPLLVIVPDLLDTICRPEVNESSHRPLYRELAAVVQSLLNVLGEAPKLASRFFSCNGTLEKESYCNFKFANF